MKSTPCVRNLPQHFNGCTCVAAEKSAGEVFGIDLIGFDSADDNAAEAEFAIATEPDAVYTPASNYAANRDRAAAAVAAVEAAERTGEQLSNVDSFDLSASASQVESSLMAVHYKDGLDVEQARALARLARARDAYGSAHSLEQRKLAAGLLAKALSDALVAGDRAYPQAAPAPAADDFDLTVPDAFEVNRHSAIRAADGDNEFEMRMAGIAMLSTLEHVEADDTIEANDRDAVDRLRTALKVTGPNETDVADFTADDVEELRDALRVGVKVGDNNLRTYDGKTARQWRDEAAARRRQSHESFERSDTDGALTQWAADVNANRYDAYAKLAADGGVSDFPALMDTNGNLVPAKLVNTRFGQSWMLLDANGDSTGEWVNPSQAATAAKRNAAMAKKGYAVGRVRAKAKIAMTEGLTPFPYRYRVDSGFDPNAEIVATAEADDD